MLIVAPLGRPPAGIPPVSLRYLYGIPPVSHRYLSHIPPVSLRYISGISTVSHRYLSGIPPVSLRYLSNVLPVSHRYRADLTRASFSWTSSLVPVACCQPVKVKAKLWQERTSKVMSQAKPQLELVQKLFREGRELGLEENGGCRSRRLRLELPWTNLEQPWAP